MTKKELEMELAKVKAENESLRSALKRADEEYNALGELDGLSRERLQAAGIWALGVGNKALEANRAAYKGDLRAARRATWELLGMFPTGHQKAREMEAARKAASTATPAKKEEVDTSDLV